MPVKPDSFANMDQPGPEQLPSHELPLNFPSLEKEKLKWYLRQYRNMRMTDEEIIKRFTSIGWPADFIIDSLAKLPAYKENVAISVNNLTKKFTTEDYEQTILRNISFDIREGEFIAITGKSGAGKTTMLNLIGLLDEPTEGEILINGKNIFSFSEKEKVKFRLKSISFIFQFFNLVNNYTAIENIAFQLRLQGYSKRKSMKKSAEILQFLGLGERANYYPKKLSGGEQQRVAIGRALAKDSLIILADEPTAHLDSKNSETTIELFRDINLKFGKTIILVTHEADYAKMADRVIILSDGMLVQKAN